MRHDPFADIARYCQFLKLQHRFHASLQPIYGGLGRDQRLSAFRCAYRLGLIEKDLADLGAASDTNAPSPIEPLDLADLPRALGWLYVAEGSNLGAAFLLKEAARLGLSQSFGARHLAAPEGGRGLYWRNFTAALDALDLEPAAEDQVVAGAREAFLTVRSLLDYFFRKAG